MTSIRASPKMLGPPSVQSTTGGALRPTLPVHWRRGEPTPKGWRVILLAIIPPAHRAPSRSRCGEGGPMGRINWVEATGYLASLLVFCTFYRLLHLLYEDDAPAPRRGHRQQPRLHD